MTVAALLGRLSPIKRQVVELVVLEARSQDDTARFSG